MVPSNNTEFLKSAPNVSFRKFCKSGASNKSIRQYMVQEMKYNRKDLSDIIDFNFISFLVEGMLICIFHSIMVATHIQMIAKSENSCRFRLFEAVPNIIKMRLIKKKIVAPILPLLWISVLSAKKAKQKGNPNPNNAPLATEYNNVISVLIASKNNRGIEIITVRKLQRCIGTL